MNGLFVTNTLAHSIYCFHSELQQFWYKQSLGGGLGGFVFPKKSKAELFGVYSFLLDKLLTGSARKKIYKAADTAADLFSVILPRCTAHVLDFSMDLVVLQ